MCKLCILILVLLLYSDNVAAIDVLVPIRNITKGEMISKEDVTMQDSKKNQNVGGYITSIDDSFHMKAKKNLQAWQPIRKTDLFIDNKLIYKGETITARLINKNLTIEVQTIALNSGAANEMIKVKCIDTGKVLNGKILEDGSLIINYK